MNGTVTASYKLSVRFCQLHSLCRQSPLLGVVALLERDRKAKFRVRFPNGRKINKKSEKSTIFFPETKYKSNRKLLHYYLRYKNC